MKNYLFVLILSITAIVNAQTASLSGVITNAKQEKIEGINVYIPEAQKGDVTNTDGFYKINNLKEGKYTILIDGLGYQSIQKQIILSAGESKKLSIILQDSPEDLQEITLVTQSESEKIRQSAFEVSVLDTEEFKNLNGDLNTVLKAAPGINIRETGGLGSSFSLSLNGLSGNQVRFFIDGIPMEGLGSSISLNNFPVNLIKSLQVYKGAVPISLGADALGGAINVTTDTQKESFLDASYTLGSFNTHRLAVNGQYVNKDKNYYLRLLSYFNHSDNDYEMKEVPLYDLELGNYFGEVARDRFHSSYTSGMAKLQAGLFNKTWADEVSLGVSYSENLNNKQHSDYSIERVFGDYQTRDNTYSVDLQYRKKWDKLKISSYVSYAEREQQTIDTSTYRYNWDGDRIQRSDEDFRGELFDRRSLVVLEDQLLRANLQANYTINNQHSLSLSATQNSFKREGYDEVNEFNTSIEFPNKLNKTILGLGYDFKPSEKVTIGAFGKQYLFDAEITATDTEDNVIISNADFNQSGYGAVATYFLNQSFQFKLSYEKAMRLPEVSEILGDGIFVYSNSSLEPEKSDNINLGFRYNYLNEDIKIKLSGNTFLRDSKDFIRFSPTGPFGQYENLDNVRAVGAEIGLQTNYKKWQASINGTYQNITDQTKTDEGLPNVNYQSRVPNEPYLFGNFRLGYELFNKEKLGSLQAHWNTFYVHEYFLFWENLGDPDTKALIPTQLANDLQIEYSSPSRQYNVSLSVNNIFDEALYDNFRIQKPGRAFYLKLRYYIN